MEDFEYVLEECTDPHVWVAIGTYPYTAVGKSRAQSAARARRQDNVAASLRLAIQDKS